MDDGLHSCWLVVNTAFALYGNVAKRIFLKNNFMVSKMTLSLAFSVLQSISFNDTGHSRESLS